MRDPLFIDNSEWHGEIPASQRIQYEQVKQSPDQLQKSLNEAHDRIRRLTNTNNNQAASLRLTTRRLDIAGVKLWVLGGLVGTETVILLYVLKAFLERVH